MDFEKPTSRAAYEGNVGKLAAKQAAIVEAVKQGNYAQAGALVEEARALEGARQRMVGIAEREAAAENTERDMAIEKESDHAEAIEMNKAFDESKAAEAAAKEKVRAAEEARLSAEADSSKAAELARQIKDGNLGGGMSAAEVVPSGSVVENSENVGKDVGTIITAMREQGYYREEFSALKPGEQPSPALATKMICSLIHSSDARFHDYAKVLMGKLPFDEEGVKKFVVKEVMSGNGINEQRLRMMNIVDIDPVSLHDDAVKELDSLLDLATRRDGAAFSIGDVARWKTTFGISEDEYAEALRKLYDKRGRGIGDDNMRALGFVRENGGRTHWAWEKE